MTTSDPGDLGDASLHEKRSVRYGRLGLLPLGLAAWLLAYNQFWDTWNYSAPVNAPISLIPAGAVEQDIDIRLDSPHELSLVFSRGTRPPEEVARLVGASGFKRQNEPFDISVPFRWSLVEVSGRVVASWDGDTHGIKGWGETELKRNVSPLLHIPAGHYRFKATVLRDVPDFQGMAARLSLALSGNETAHYWHDDLGFWGGLLNLLVIVPIIGGFVLIVVGVRTSNWRLPRQN